MKIIYVIILISFFTCSLMSQDKRVHPPFELQGSVSYSNSTLRMAERSINTENEVIRPTIGYFISDEIELLFDIQYVYSNQKYIDSYGINEWKDYHLGYSIGASYNIPVRPQNIIPFVGIRIGQLWSKHEYKQYLPESTKWGKPEITFPDLFMGTRIFLNTNWSLIVSLEYLKTKPSADLPIYWDENESTLFGVGFSVFL